MPPNDMGLPDLGGGLSMLPSFWSQQGETGEGQYPQCESFLPSQMTMMFYVYSTMKLF